MRFGGSDEYAALRNLVRDLLSKGHRKILFNLQHVSYIDSSGLGHLVSAFTAVQKEKGQLKLLNLAKNVHDVMQITKLYTIFDITQTIKEAAYPRRKLGLGSPPPLLHAVGRKTSCPAYLLEL